MAYEDLNRELQDINPAEYRDAVWATASKVVSNQDVDSVATDFAERYVGLNAGALEFEKVLEDLAAQGADPGVVTAMRVAFRIGQWSLRDMIDTANMREQFDDPNQYK